MDINQVGIIGGGSELGEALARALTRAAIRNSSSGRPQQSGDDLCGRELTLGIREAADKEIVFLAIPWADVRETLSLISDWEGRILIDATDPILADGQLAKPQGRTSSEAVRDLAPGAQLVKAFNSVSPELICAEARQFGGRRVVFFSGDHIRAKREVARLIGYLGFAGIDLGGLAEGGRLQQFPDGPLRGLNLIKFDVQDVSVEM